MDKQTLTKLFHYHYWANRRLWRSVLALSEAQFTQPLRDGSPSIHSQIVRMVAHENLWVNYLWHGEVEFLRETHLPTRARIQREWQALEEEMCDFIDDLSPAALDQRIDPVFLKGSVPLSIEEILLQIVHEAIVGRAHISLHLRHLGSPAAASNFFDFLTEQRPAIQRYPPRFPRYELLG